MRELQHNPPPIAADMSIQFPQQPTATHRFGHVNLSHRKLFAQLPNPAGMFLLEPQTYTPLYDSVFADATFASNRTFINPDHDWHITDIVGKKTDNIFQCKLTRRSAPMSRTQSVFVKTIPLLNPISYICGRYPVHTEADVERLLGLPSSADKNLHKCHRTTAAANHMAYTDAFFVYLSDRLLQLGLPHGLEYYGTFLGKKGDCRINVGADYDHIKVDKQFHHNRNRLYTMDADYDYLFEDALQTGQKPSLRILTDQCPDICLDDLCDNSDPPPTLATTMEAAPQPSPQQDADESVWESATASTSTFDEEFLNIYVNIPLFPVAAVCMEKCTETVEILAVEKAFHSPAEWFAMFMQVIMCLIAYQDVYDFTHNDLHVGNIMYVTTTEKWLRYVYRGIHYKVPTYGRIYKIIDFGRAIYTLQGRRYCNTAYARGGHAEGQYNTEPYLRQDKPRLEPNPAFDLCYLACGLMEFFDANVAEDGVNTICNADTLHLCTDPVQRLVMEWCQDDRGKNVQFKSSGAPRYDGFKLYQMIARTVHGPTPHEQLSRPQFAKYRCGGAPTHSAEAAAAVINLDAIIAEAQTWSRQAQSSS